MSEVMRHLQSTLDEVQAKLAESEELDVNARQLLSQLETEIAEALKQQNTRHFEDNSILDKLRDAAAEFEAEHPIMSKFLFSTIDGLRQLGI